jgi:peptidoglycan L-alanyl-D-glutamate endopeptidase CwlK
LWHTINDYYYLRIIGGLMFKLSQKSLDKLQGVDSRLVKIVYDAIKISTVDFIVGEGVRTLERQKFLIKQGKSHIANPNNGKHVKGLAVDLYAYVNGAISWNEAYYDDIADAMRDSANGVKIRWGAVWDKPLNDVLNCESEPRLYAQRRKAQGKKAFLDFVHFEIMD